MIKHQRQTIETVINKILSISFFQHENILIFVHLGIISIKKKKKSNMKIDIFIFVLILKTNSQKFSTNISTPCISIFQKFQYSSA